MSWIIKKMIKHNKYKFKLKTALKLISNLFNEIRYLTSSKFPDWHASVNGELIFILN